MIWCNIFSISFWADVIRCYKEYVYLRYTDVRYIIVKKNHTAGFEPETSRSICRKCLRNRCRCPGQPSATWPCSGSPVWTPGTSAMSWRATWRPRSAEIPLPVRRSYRIRTDRWGECTRDVIFRKMTNRNQTDTNEMTTIETKYQNNFILPQNTNI